MSRDNNRQTQHKQRQQQAAVKDAVRAAAAVYTDSADAERTWSTSGQHDCHVAQHSAAQANAQLGHEAPALYLDEFTAQQQQRSMLPPHFTGELSLQFKAQWETFQGQASGRSYPKPLWECLRCPA